MIEKLTAPDGIRDEIAREYFKETILSEEGCIRLANIAIEIFIKHLYRAVGEI